MMYISFIPFTLSTSFKLRMRWTVKQKGIGGVEVRLYSVSICNTWRKVVKFTPRPLYPPGERIPVHIKRERRRYWSRSQCVDISKKRNDSLSLPGCEPQSPTPGCNYYTDCTIPAPLCSVGYWQEMLLQDEGLCLSNMQLVHKSPWEAANRSERHSHQVLWSPKVHYRAHKRPSHDHLLN